MSKIVLLIVLFCSAQIAIAQASQSISSTNSIYCHGCSESTLRQELYEKALEIGFPDPMFDPDDNIPVTVYSFDIATGMASSHDVYNRMDLLTNSPYMTLDVSHMVPGEVGSAWYEFSRTTKDFFSSPFESSLNGYDVLLSPQLQSQVASDINNTWYILVNAAVRDLDVLGAIFKSIDFSVISSINVTFADNIVMTFKLENIEQVTLNDISNLDLKYLPDSAFLIMEDGTLLKIPDDSSDNFGPLVVTLTEDEALPLYDYLSNYGYTSTGGGALGGFGNSNIVCNVTHVEETVEPDGTIKRSATYRCTIQ